MSQGTVFIVDDDPAICDSLTWLLDSANLSAKSFTSAEDFLKHYNVYMTGCLVLDIRMPQMSGLQLQQILRQQKYSLPIIFITGHGDVPLAVRAMQQGATHFFEKPLDNEAFLQVLSEALDTDYKNQRSRLQLISINARYENLTDREREVFDLVVKRLSNMEIAAKLNIKVKTVEFHRSNMMEKMHAETVLDLLDYAKILIEAQKNAVIH